MRRTVALAALLLSVAAPAAAQDRPSSQPDVYDFEDDLVNGTIQAPLGDILHVRRGAGRRTLIQARAHFIPELTQTVENL